MLKKTLLLMMAGVVSLPMWSQTDEQVQWEAYKKIIPSYESIYLSDKDSYTYEWLQNLQGRRQHDFCVSIGPNYSVSLTGNSSDEIYTKSQSNATYKATGIVKWDSENKRMVVQLRGSSSVSGVYGKEVGRQFTQETCSDTRDINLTFVLRYDNNNKKFRIVNAPKIEVGKYVAGMCGQSLDINKATCKYGNKRAEVTNADQFGQWKWNGDRSVIYLKSNMSDSQLQIIRSNGLQLVLKLPSNAVGISQQSTDNGTMLDMFELSFDGTSLNSFLFARQGNGTFKYAVYNRFTNELSFNASSIINQIGKKQTINIDYRLSNGERRSEMFILEGLEAILGYLK